MSIQYASLQKGASLGTGDISDPDFTAIDAGTILDIETTHGIDIQNATCTLTLGALPEGADEGQFLVCTGGVGSSTTLFNGEVDDIVFPGDGTAKLIGTGYLARLDQDWGEVAYEYTSQLASAVLRNLIEKSAVPSSLHSVEDSTWMLGVAQAVPLRAGDNPLKLARDIVDAHLWWMAEHSNGAIYAAPIALTTPVASYTSGGRPVLKLDRTRTRRGLRNKVIVDGLPSAIGLPLTSEASATSIWVPDPPKYWTFRLNSSLIEDQTTADARAAAGLALYNARPEYFSVITRLDGTVQPGDTVTLTSAECQIEDVDVFVTGVTRRLRACTEELRCWRIPS